MFEEDDDDILWTGDVYVMLESVALARWIDARAAQAREADRERRRGEERARGKNKGKAT